MARKLKDPWPRQRVGFGGWLRDHWRIANEAFSYVSLRLGTSLLVWLLVGIALALPSGLYLLQQNLADMTQGWEGRPGLSLYFEPGVEPAVLAAAAQQLQDRSEVAEIKVINQAQALADFREFGALGDALDILGDNPLPASIRATLATDATLADLETLSRIAERGEGVTDVVLEKTWLERVIDISTLVTRLGLVLGALFALGAVLVTATSVRLAIEARLEEVRVMKLVGATEGQIRRPFLYFGALYGLGGAIVAAMLLSAALLVVEQPINHLLNSYGQGLELSGFNPIFLVALLGIGAVLGVLGSLLAAHQRLADLAIH